MTTPTKEVLIHNTLALANVAELVSRTMSKVGLEYIAPLEESVQNEQISKALNMNITPDEGC